jgi:uncharacterized protein (DUF362 family)
MKSADLTRRSFLRWFSLFSLLGLLSSKIGDTRALAPQNSNRKMRDVGEKSKAAVVRVHSSAVIREQNASQFNQEPFNADALDEMLSEGMKTVTGRKNLRDAWMDVLARYSRGDKIVVKPNFNFVNKETGHAVTSPQLINSVVGQLVEVVGVAPENISLYDLCKKIPGSVRNAIRYPISFVERADASTVIDKIRRRLHVGPASADRNAEIIMREKITESGGAPVRCYMPRVVSEAQHLINMPLLTNHPFIASSGALKNHFGTVRFSNYNSYPEVLHGRVLAKSIVDINANEHIKNKTRLVIGDGLFGVFDRGDGGGKKKWKTFRDDFPKSIFLSRDPVAIDAVMANLVIRERKQHHLTVLPTEYLLDAEARGLGVCELQDGESAYTRIDYRTISLQGSVPGGV